MLNPKDFAFLFFFFGNWNRKARLVLYDNLDTEKLLFLTLKNFCFINYSPKCHISGVEGSPNYNIVFMATRVGFWIPVQGQ